MFLNNYILYLLAVYLLVWIALEMVLGKAFRPGFFLGFNIAFLGLLFESNGSLSLTYGNSLLVAIYLIGATLVALRSLELFNARVNFQLLVSLALLLSENIFISCFGLLLHIHLLTCSTRNKKVSVLDASFGAFLLAFALMYSSDLGSNAILSLSSKSPGQNLLISLCSFFILYGSMRMTLYLISSEQLTKKDINLKIWTWLGVVQTYFIFIASKVDLKSLMTDNLFYLIWIMLLVLSLLLLFFIENCQSSYKKLAGMITFGQLIMLLSIFSSIKTTGFLYATNLTILLSFVYADSLFSSKEKDLKGLSIIYFLIVMFLLLSFPFIPWFQFKLSLIKYLLDEENWPFVTILFLLLGASFRQKVLFFTEIVKYKLTERKKVQQD